MESSFKILGLKNLSTLNPLMPGSNKMSYRFVKVCINFCYHQALKGYDVNQHY